MKKLILLLSVLSIFLIPSMSFADSYPSPPIQRTYTAIYNSTSGIRLVTSNSPITISENLLHIKSNSEMIRYSYDAGFWTDPTTGNLFGGYKSFIQSSHDIYISDSSNVFFSIPPVPITQISGVEELPQEVVKHGGIVLSVALTGFGILLVVSLIPRLVKRFLY